MKQMVYANQTFLDKVIECTGSIDNAFDMALLNKIIVTDDVVVGTELLINKVSNKVIFNFFTANNRPATGIVAENKQTQPYGFPYGFPVRF